MLHWGPFSLKSGKKTLWSSEYENLYGDVVNLPCTGGNLVDAVVILDTSNPTATPRAVEYEYNEVNNKGWNLQNNNSNNNNNSNSLGRFLAPQPHHKTKSPNLEYSMTSSQSDAHRVIINYFHNFFLFLTIIIIIIIIIEWTLYFEICSLFSCTSTSTSIFI